MTFLACQPSSSSSAEGPSRGGSDHDLEAEAFGKDRIAIPAAVRKNLGITFVTAEIRAVRDALRIPGHLELTPSAQRHYHTPIAGRVELVVEELDTVEAGQPVYRLTSPTLHELQEKISETEISEAKLRSEAEAFAGLEAAHAEHEARLEESIAVQESQVERFESLSEAGAGQASQLLAARAGLATARAELAGAREKEAELRSGQAGRIVELEGLASLRSVLLGSLASDTGLTRESLIKIDDQSGTPRWRSLHEIVVRAEAPGRVASLDVTTGAWVDERALILSVVDPSQLRFSGHALQSDGASLADGMKARAIPAGTTGEAVDGTLRLGLSGNAATRTLEVLMRLDAAAAWARPDMAAELEISTAESDPGSVAVPLAAVRSDGLERVLFRRDPKKPSEVVRVTPAFGVSDGRWIEVLDGISAGDEIVLDGGFQLLLSGGGAGMQKGGHFHADGTFHDGDH